MEPENNKTKALSKEETIGLLAFIEGSRIINNKKTNATSNKMKIDEWERITKAFNASVGVCHRTPQQLRLKWENLKKNSRKRCTQIRMERIKTGGGPPGYFPADDILDRVAALLGSTGEGLTVRFGGDAEESDCGGGGDGRVGGGGVGDGTTYELIIRDSQTPKPLTDSSLPVVVEHSSAMPNRLINYIIPMASENSTLMHNEVPANGFGDGLVLGSCTPSTPVLTNNKRYFRSSGIKRKLQKPDDNRDARNTALAEYYNIKKKFLEGKFENIKLENENLKLENEKLKLEIKKLKGEDI